MEGKPLINNKSFDIPSLFGAKSIPDNWKSLNVKEWILLRCLNVSNDAFQAWRVFFFENGEFFSRCAWERNNMSQTDSQDTICDSLEIEALLPFPCCGIALWSHELIFCKRAQQFYLFGQYTRCKQYNCLCSGSRAIVQWSARWIIWSLKKVHAITLRTLCLGRGLYQLISPTEEWALAEKAVEESNYADWTLTNQNHTSLNYFSVDQTRPDACEQLSWDPRIKFRCEFN